MISIRNKTKMMESQTNDQNKINFNKHKIMNKINFNKHKIR